MRFFRRCLFGLGLACIQVSPAWAFTQEVYVWQRQFSPAVYQALESVRKEATGSAILAAEVTWDGDRPRLFRSTVSYASLAAIGRPVGIVLRIGPYARAFASDDKTARYLANLGQSLIKAAKAGGL